MVLLLFAWPAPPPAMAARFPPPIEKHTYSPPIEKVLQRLKRTSLRPARTLECAYRLTTRLHVTNGARITNTFPITRRGICYAQGDRLDIRRFAAGAATETQLVRRQNTFLEYWVYEGELRRLWPDSIEKDQRADELVYGYVWLPVLANLYPDEYLRWADRYEFARRVVIEGKSYDVLRALPDYEPAIKNRRLQSSAAYWGLRPEIRFYINPRNRRIEIIERLFYRWSRARPDDPSYLYRTCVSRVVEWSQHGRLALPSRIVAQEFNPREPAPYKEFELRLENITIGGAVPRSAFAGIWPQDEHPQETEWRAPHYYRKLVPVNLRQMGQDLTGPLLATHCAFVVGDHRYARDLMGRIRSCVAESLSVGDLAAFCRTGRASADQTLISDSGGLLQAALAELSTHRAGLSEEDSRTRRHAALRLHFAVSEHLSRRLPANAPGEAWDDRAAAAAYLESILGGVTDPALRARVVARIAVEYARVGLFAKAQDVLNDHAASCITGPVSQDYFEGARQRVRYWYDRRAWWAAVRAKMQRRELKREARQRNAQ